MKTVMKGCGEQYGIHIDDSAKNVREKLQNGGRRKATKIKRASAVIIKTVDARGYCCKPK